jgi:HEPN domain-containing protein
MPQREHIELLLRRASEDEEALDILMRSPAAPAAVLGFHAQQAAEKLLKAALKSARVEYPYTHVLDHLLRLLAGEGAVVPEALREVRMLTPFAAQLRYETLDDDAAMAADIAQVRQLLRDLRIWVEALVEGRNWGEPPTSA